MSRYDGLIIPRSYSEYINKTDAATLLQALQLSGVMDAAPTAGSNHPAKSGGIYEAMEKTVSTNYYNANTDRNVLQNRIDAIKSLIQQTRRLSNISLVRYAGGYYFTYIFPEKVNTMSITAGVLEIDPHTGKLCIFSWDENMNVVLAKTFS